MRIVYNPLDARPGDVIRFRTKAYWRVLCISITGTLGVVRLRWWQVPWAVLCDMHQSVVWMGQQ